MVVNWQRQLTLSIDVVSIDSIVPMSIDALLVGSLSIDTPSINIWPINVTSIDVLLIDITSIAYLSANLTLIFLVSVFVRFWFIFWASNTHAKTHFELSTIILKKRHETKRNSIEMCIIYLWSVNRKLWPFDGFFEKFVCESFFIQHLFITESNKTFQRKKTNTNTKN